VFLGVLSLALVGGVIFFSSRPSGSEAPINVESQTTTVVMTEQLPQTTLQLASPQDQPVVSQNSLEGARSGTPPSITSITVSRDSAGPGDSFSISAWVADTEGVDLVAFIIDSMPFTATMCRGEPRLQTGSNSSGNWVLDCLVPAEPSATGDFIITADAFDTTGEYGESFPVAAAISINGPASTTRDAEPPLITGISVSPSSVQPGGNFTISLQVQDASGISAAGFGIVKAGVNSYTGLCERAPMTLVSGDEFAGTWSRTCTVPTDYNNFGDHVIYGTAADYAGNGVQWQGSSLRAFFTVNP
jgi:hypothetical protein